MAKRPRTPAKRPITKKVPRAPRPAVKVNITTWTFVINDALCEKLAPLLPVP